MSVLATINGIDLVLTVIAVTCAVGWRHSNVLLNLYRHRLTEVEEARVMEQYGRAPDTKTVQGFTGRGEPIKAGIPVTVGRCVETGCRLVEGHAGPHMSQDAVWTSE